METSVTLVSCLYWLARTKWQHSGFPPNYDRYSSWSENFLSLDANIVIFTDDHYYPAVMERRRKYDPDLSKTVVVTKKLHELEFYEKYFFKMSVLMSSPQFKAIKHADCADNMYPLYNVVQYNKISLIKEVKDANPFGATHFMWMDCGSCRDGLEKYKNKKFPTNKRYINDKVIHFSHNLEFGLCERKQDYFLSQIRNIQGTAWIMPSQHVEKYHELISHELESTMNDGFIGSDEKTYDSIYQNNKDIVELVKCGWFQFFDVMSTCDAPAEECHSTQEEVSQHPEESHAVEQEVSALPQEQVQIVEEVAAPCCEQPQECQEQQVEVKAEIVESASESANCNYVPAELSYAEAPVAKKRAWWQIFGGA